MLTDFGAQGVGVAVNQAVSSAAGTLLTELTGATTTVVVTPTSGTFDVTNTITVGTHATKPVPAVVDESATTKWGDIGDWDTSGVKDFSHAFTKHRDQAGGSMVNNGNPKAATFVGTTISKWNTASATSLAYTFQGASVMNADLTGWKVGKVVTLYGTFSGASKFTGTGVDTWDVAKVTAMTDTFTSTTSLTTCNKRKIADAWKSSAVFVATDYDTDWAADTCPVRMS